MKREVKKEIEGEMKRGKTIALAYLGVHLLLLSYIAFPTVVLAGGKDYPIVAEVYYTYRVDGELYTGVNEKPFIIRNSGENYVSHFAPGTKFAVRVNAKDATDSLVRDGDRW